MKYHILIEDVIITKRKTKQKLFYFICGCLVFCFWFFLYVSWDRETLPFNTKLFSIKKKLLNEEKNPQETNSRSWEEFVIKQPGCRIPGMVVLGPAISKYLEKSEEINCEFRGKKTRKKKKWEPAFVEDDINSLVINQSLLTFYNKQNVNCTFQSFYRSEVNENNSNLDIENSIKYFTDVNRLQENKKTIIASESQEFVKVVCTDHGHNKKKNETKKPFYEDYFAFVPLKNEVEKRCDEFDEKTNVNRISVAIIGLDALSRLNFHRQMPTSARYLSNEMGAIEMLGFNKIGDNTFPNLVPLLNNLSVEELKEVCWYSQKDVFDECPFIWKKFQKTGFRTVFAEDSPNIGVFNYLKNGFLRQPTDYYLRPFYVEAENKIGSKKPGNAFLCIGSRLSLAVMLKYATKHIKTFQTKKFFGFFWSTSFTHDYFNLPKEGDEAFLHFLKELHENKLLNETIFIVISDHGLRWGDFRETYQGHLEERLPMLIFVFPSWFQRKYKIAIENLRRNTNHLTTHYDLHQTLLDFMNLTKIEDNEIKRRSLNFLSRSQSLFVPVSINRTCSVVGIPKHYCTCHDTVRQIDPGDELSIKTANVMLDNINFLLRDHPYCSKLNLKSIQKVSVEQSTMGGKITDGLIISDYIITVKTYPGGGLFEATIRHNNVSDTYLQIGQVSRINEYGSQSSCVNDYILKLYCYCKH